ncbi:hypothetical protein [Deinococcus knuensis]|uniref:Copper resistance protein CopC n=1 Tax=Deinococcus knuensis TaxID=1837380 RepID=A0ABQ2SEJ7_9DEIO|nr:hypothetical protein [Deinococcus knuensis]GGS25653.1 hypothetical protein GCM10008961_16420 [Deinococcus knuensis]
MRGAARLLALLSLTLPVQAAAHETQSAGQVQVTFSTDVDDTLSTQGPTLLQFVLTGPGGDLPGCRCRLLLYQGMPSARVAPLLDVRLEALQQGVTRLELPKVAPGGYTVVLDGRPVNFGDFDAFRLRYMLPAP